MIAPHPETALKSRQPDQLAIIRETGLLKEEDLQAFLLALLEADVKAEYVEQYRQQPPQDLEETYTFALQRLPTYFNLIQNNQVEDTTILAKGMVWLGTIGVAAMRKHQVEPGATNTIIKTILKYPHVTSNEIEQATMDDLHDLMLAICYQKVAPFFAQEIDMPLLEKN